jgi:hypothetical protein
MMERERENQVQILNNETSIMKLKEKMIKTQGTISNMIEAENLNPD